MKKRTRALTLKILSVSAVLLVLIAAFFLVKPHERGTEPAPPTAELLSAKISRLLSIPSIEHEYREIIYFGSEKSFLFIPTASKRLLFSLNIRVQAGINLAKGFVLIPGPDGSGTITVKLPPPEILLVDADEESIFQYFAQEHRDRIRLLEFGDEIRKLKERVSADAEQRGILLQAESTVRELIARFLRLQGFSSVAFERRTNDRSEGRGAE